MFLGVYRFEGEPAVLWPAYQRLLEAIPPAELRFHACVERTGALEAYDACPTREAFESFAGSPAFAELVRESGLPPPRITPLGVTRSMFVAGRRVE